MSAFKDAVTNNYYELRQYVSNSDLGSLDKVLTLTKPLEGIQKIYDFGNLVDAMKTEREKLNHDDKTVTDDGGRVMTFTDEEWEKAQLMTEALDAHPFLSKIITDRMKFQYVILREQFEIEWQGIKIKMPMRCKFDGLEPGVIALDIKTTGCTTQKQFVESIFHFCYDRQGALYMDMARVDRMIYAGVSKVINRITKKHEVFIFMIERGDKTYLSGKRKYSFLGTRYYYLLHSLDTHLLTISIKSDERTTDQTRYAF